MLPIAPQPFGMALMMLFKCKPIPDGLGTVDLEFPMFLGEIVEIMGWFTLICCPPVVISLTSTQNDSETLVSAGIVGIFELDTIFDELQEPGLLAIACN